MNASCSSPSSAVPPEVAAKPPSFARRAAFHVLLSLLLLATPFASGIARAATPCDGATHPAQCAWLDAVALPPFVQDAIVAKGGVPAAGKVLVLSSGDPADGDSEISTDLGQAGCGTNPDGWETYDCLLLDAFVPPEDSVVLAVSSEWFEWYQTTFTDWMTIAGAGVPTVDVSINSWIDNKVDILPYGPMETGAVLLTSLSAEKMVNFRVADSGDHIYDTAIIVAPASWFSDLSSSNSDPTLLCGDGQLEPGEECDDGNLDPDDGCSNLCLGTQPPPTEPPSVLTCGNLVYTWLNGTTSPYTCGADLCAGFRCVIGNSISPACYTADQCASACAGDCVHVQSAQLDCSTMCTVQPPATEPPPPATTCDKLVYAWQDGTTMPYTCEDDCEGQRCVIGATISPECFHGSDCDETTCPGGTCVNTPTDDCPSLCAYAELSPTCAPEEEGLTRLAVNQNGPCFGNHEICKSTGEWRLDDFAFQPDDEACNGIDDDCNGVADDMFQTCGDPGLCQNTVNTCDPANPGVPVVCQTLPPPSPVEICNNGLDDDCEGSPDDGCECGDDECMPGESYSNCPADCPPPPNGSPCEDGNFCTSGDSWLNGTCVPGDPVVCDSGNACLIDGSCDPAKGCSATKLSCDDSIACTEDGCDSVTGCSNTPVDSACDDGDPCTIDSCNVGSGCGHDPDPSCSEQDLDGDGHASIETGGDDCNDGDAQVHPGAAERCNAIDDDCDASTDEGFDVGAACESAPNECGNTSAGSLECSVDGLSVTCDAAVPAAEDGDGDGTPDCLDSCPADPAKTAPGVCGCGIADADTNANGIVDCQETVRADLGISITPLGKPARAGKRLRFRLDATNSGPDQVVPGATITASISGAVEDLKLHSSCTGSLGAIVCTTKPIGPNHKKGRKVSVIPSAGATVTVTASVSSPVLDPNPMNQSATVVTLVP